MEDVSEKPLQPKFHFMDVPEKPLQLKFHFIFLTLFSILVASIVTYSSSVLTVFSYFLPLVVSIGLFFAAVVIFGWISPPKADCPARKPEQSSSTMPQVIHNLDARKLADAQRGEGNAQIGGGGHNPQVQGNINAGSGGNINLGLQDVNLGLQDKNDSPQDNKDTPKGNKDKKGNAQIGGGGHNPQVQGNINAGSGGNINLGLQGANVNLRKSSACWG